MQGAVTGPRRPSSIETQPAAMLGMNAVTSVGGIRPLGASSQHSVRLATPPWAVAIEAPTRPTSSETSSPESASAMRAAATASCVNRSVRCSALRSSQSPGTNSSA